MWGGAGGPPPPAQVQAGGIPGCLKAAIILGVIAIVALIVFVFLLSRLVGGFLDSAGLGGLDGGGDGGSLDANCAFLSDDEAREVLGGAADAMEFSGLYETTLGFVIDMRALPSAPDCWIDGGQKAYIARIARSEGDGAAVFAQEKANAQPTSQDQGGGVTLENSGYFAGDVSGLGDEAFCTGISTGIMAGVLVRQGDTVVYVSVGPSSEGDTSVPDMGTFGDVVTAPGLCALSQELARKVLD